MNKRTNLPDGVFKRGAVVHPLCTLARRLRSILETADVTELLCRVVGEVALVRLTLTVLLLLGVVRSDQLLLCLVWKALKIWIRTPMVDGSA